MIIDRVVHATVVVLLAAGCGDDAPDDGEPRDAPAAPPDVDTAACGAVGTPCTPGCPGDLSCLTHACVPMRGSCGGFTGELCQDPNLTCVYPTGSSAGICMTPDEHACVCALAADELAGCEQQ